LNSALPKLLRLSQLSLSRFVRRSLRRMVPETIEICPVLEEDFATSVRGRKPDVL
jgi:hypothetical protein